jgi:UDP-N-acetylmuramate dehydrogenase
MLNIQEKVILAPLTSFRIGGMARFFVEVRSVDELKEALEFAKDKKVDYYMLGGGSNVIVSDEGFDGLVIKMKMNDIKVDGLAVEAEAGVPLIKVVNVAAENGLTGIEKLAGIPGTLGGAVRGNAGAFSFETRVYISKVIALDANTFEIKEFSNQECYFDYRSSYFKNNKKYIVIKAILELEKSDSETCRQKVKETIIGRSTKELHGVKSAGLFFMNPKAESDSILLKEFAKDRGVEARNNVLPAAWVIAKAGLGGKEVGGAFVSEKNTNYIVNSGEAKGSDVAKLAQEIKTKIKDEFGLNIQEEVEYIGF